MSKINPAGQLLLPLVGVRKKLLEKYKVVIHNVGFKYEKHGTRTVPYTLFIRIQENYEFLKYLNENVSVLKYYQEYEELILMLECLHNHTDDWKTIIRGKYSKISGVGKAAILANLGERKEEWRKVFNKTKDDVISHIEAGLNRPKLTPRQRREVAEDLYTNVTSDYEMYGKLNKNFV